MKLSLHILLCVMVLSIILHKVSPAKKHKLKPPPKTALYNVKVKTCDVQWAGTDSKVYIKFYGRKGQQTRAIKLGKPRKHYLFEKGRTDNFLVRAQYVGPVTAVALKRSKGGWLDDWKPCKIMVEYAATPVFKFIFREWIEDVWVKKRRNAVKFIPRKFIQGHS